MALVLESNISLSKDGDIFCINGELKAVHHELKSVEVEGEIYTRTTPVEHTYIFSNEPCRDEPFEIKIECLDLTYKFRDYRNFTLGIYKDTINRCLSDNNYVALFQLLYETKNLDKRIKNLYTSKGDVSFEDLDYSLRHTTLIPIVIDGYGFNNSIFIDVDFRTFYSIKHKVSNRYKKYFMKYFLIDLDNVSEFEFLSTLMKYKVKQKKMLRC